MRVVFVAAALAAAFVQTLPAPPTVTVSAAISLTDVLTSVAESYGSKGYGGVRFNFAASNVLAQQIVNGAPVDVFVSADEAQMDAVERAGLIVPGSRVDLLANQLAVVVPSDRRRTFTSMRDLLDPAFKRIAIGDPGGVPAGVYAKQYLENIGLWSTLQPRIVPSGSVRAALAAVETGAADAAIVYRTDARIASRAVVAWVVPAAQGPHIVYPAAIVKGSREQGSAKRFLDYLQSAEASQVFERFGFSKPVGGKR